MEDIKNRIKKECLEKEPPSCVAACPFGLDVREFISRMQRGSYNLAYRLYANSVGFPRIVSSLCDSACSEKCPRKDIDSSVNLRLLEEACVKYAVSKKPNSYNMPSKNKKAAIIGAGLSGLACALRLCNKKYDVTIFEKNYRIGGSILEQADAEIFLKDIEEQFVYEEYNLYLNTNITDIEKIAGEFDAVYIASGKNGSDFGLRFDGNMSVAPAELKSVFAGGGLLGHNLPRSIACGLQAAVVIENYIKTGNMKGKELQSDTKIKLDLSKVVKKDAVIPLDGFSYTKEEAQNEANRCLKCRCEACYIACDMMSYFEKFPKLIEGDVHITIHPGTLDGNGTVATRLISTCNQCGLCSQVCPINIDMGMFMRQSHNAMRAKNAMPWAFHEFWLRDMEFANNDRAAFFYRPDENVKSPMVFFPGCQIGASNPDYVLKPYDFILEKLPNTALMLECCGAPAVWAGDEPLQKEVFDLITEKWSLMGEPEFIFACPSCMDMFSQYMPMIKGRMLCDVLYELGIIPAENVDGIKASVFDPCAARKYQASQQTVRNIAKQAGYSLIPLDFEGKTAKCCSWGGQISIANPPYTELIVHKRITAGEFPYIVYCTNCRDIFAEAGKPVKHILDVLFTQEGWDRRPPLFSERRSNREYLKKELAKKFLNIKAEGDCAVNIKMSSDMKLKLHKNKILEEDVRSVIEFCETSGRKIFDNTAGHFIGYTEIGHMTCWVEYTKEDNGYYLHNAYSHRMKIELEEVWNGRKQATNVC